MIRAERHAPCRAEPAVVPTGSGRSADEVYYLGGPRLPASMLPSVLACWQMKLPDMVASSVYLGGAALGGG